MPSYCHIKAKKQIRFSFQEQLMFLCCFWFAPKKIYLDITQAYTFWAFQIINLQVSAASGFDIVG